MRVRCVVNLQLGILYVLYLSICVFAIGKCQNRRMDCPRELINTPCSCTKTVEEDGLEVVCENADVDQIGILLEKIPKETVIKHMRLHGGQIVHLPGLKFQHLHIHHLYITRSNLHEIDPMAFFNLDNTLYSLDLSGNQLSNIPAEAIKRLKVLRSINLSTNRITRVLPNTFAGMSALLNVKLDHNIIEEVETFAFNGADNLTKIHLNHNKIKKLPGRMFSKLAGLEELYLSYNQLDTFPEGFFQGITTSLNRLDLNHNLFHEIPPAIAALQQLEILNINHNCLDDVSGDAFSSSLSSQLSALDVSSNNLTKVPVEALSALDSLSHLNMQNNSITEIPPLAFKTLANSLKYLYLQHNRISNISAKALHGLRHLEWLYLSENNISVLHEETFKPVKKSLKILDVHDNPFKCDCKLKWISHAQWPALLSHEKETKCDKPGPFFGYMVTQNLPQVCEFAHPEANKLRQLPNNTATHPALSGLLHTATVVLLTSAVFQVVCSSVVLIR